ncbi:hypothetical protein EE612_011199, partial [Oryza sativa]
AGLPHDPAHAGVVEDGDDELVKLYLDREERLLLRSMQPRRWFACARLSAATSALDSVGSGGTSDDAGEHARPQSAIALVAGRRLSATLKQSSSALHRSGCDAAAAAGAQAATAGSSAA